MLEDVCANRDEVLDPDHTRDLSHDLPGNMGMSYDDQSNVRMKTGIWDR